jgi:tRNA1Val (adenine37-N6)-methyltransferase
MSTPEDLPQCNVDPYFRDWAKPGPRPDLPEKIDLAADESIDGLCGHYRIFQLKAGHRYSTDDVLTAWYATSWCPSARRILDLGSGLGSVAMIAAWRLPGGQIVSVEAQERSVALARKSVAYNGLAERFDIRLGDFRDEAVFDADERFDLVLGSPPYFPESSGVVSQHPQRRACRFEVRGTIDDYCRVAAQRLNLGGWFTCIFPIEPSFQHGRVLDAAVAADLSIIRWRPVVMRAPEQPRLGLFCMVKRDHIPAAMRETPWAEPPLIIRGETGAVHPEYEAIKLSFGFPPERPR